MMPIENTKPREFFTLMKVHQRQSDRHSASHDDRFSGNISDFMERYIYGESQCSIGSLFRNTLDIIFYWGLTPQQQPGSYKGGEMMMKSVFWWRKPEYLEETTDLRQVTDKTVHTYGLCPVRGLNLGRSSVKQSELRKLTLEIIC